MGKCKVGGFGRRNRHDTDVLSNAKKSIIMQVPCKERQYPVIVSGLQKNLD